MHYCRNLGPILFVGLPIGWKKKSKETQNSFLNQKKNIYEYSEFFLQKMQAL